MAYALAPEFTWIIALSWIVRLYVVEVLLAGSAALGGSLPLFPFPQIFLIAHPSLQRFPRALCGCSHAQLLCTDDRSLHSLMGS